MNDLTFGALRAANEERQRLWCADGAGEPDLAFRGVELAGEGGEAVEALLIHAAEISRSIGRASNLVKKLERERHGWRGSRASKEDLASEIADVIICADLLASAAGIDLAAAVAEKFNATSEKVGLDECRLYLVSIEPRKIDLDRIREEDPTFAAQIEALGRDDA